MIKPNINRILHKKLIYYLYVLSLIKIYRTDIHSINFQSKNILIL